MLTSLLLAGCSSDERVVQVATEAADRQADQNRQMSQLQEQVQQERQALSHGWTDLNSQRRQLAETRRADGERHRARQGFAVVFVAVLVLVLTWQLLHARPTATEVELDALELLVAEQSCHILALTGTNEPPPEASTESAPSPQQLPHDQSAENSPNPTEESP
ncbi:MAG: hypothetical protein RH917_03015 [Lacipirellulaceae bacterium]